MKKFWFFNVFSLVTLFMLTCMGCGGTVDDGLFITPTDSWPPANNEQQGDYYGKIAPTAAKGVGDILFSDGSATSCWELYGLTDEQKSHAVAVIFYSGTELNSGDDETTVRTLGVALNFQEKYVWATDTVALCGVSASYDNEVNSNLRDSRRDKTRSDLYDAISCYPDGRGAYQTFFYSGDSFAGDKNGSDNYEVINELLINNYYTLYYPRMNISIDAFVAMNAVKNYSSIKYEPKSVTGWYLPSTAEMFKIWENRNAVNRGIEMCGGKQFIEDENYWSSSSNWASIEGYYGGAYTVEFSKGISSFVVSDYVTKSYYCCAIREF